MKIPFKKCNTQLVVWIYIVLLNFRGSYCQFVNQPRNTLAYVGQSVTLDCTIDNAGEDGHIQVWREYITKSGGQSISQNGKVFDEKYEIVDKFNLKIKAAGLHDGGTYSCQDVLVNQVVYKADLVVLKSDPTMTSSISSGLVMEITEVQYTCKVSYQGNLVPVMKWKTSDGEIVVHSDSSNSGYVETSIAFIAGPSNNGHSYSCQTYFEDRTISGIYQASNTLQYSYQLSTTPLEVHYNPRDTQIVDLNNNPINRGSNIFAGKQLRCVTNSNPPPNGFIWTNIRDQKVVSTDPIFTIGENLIGELSLQCSVTNYMGATGQVVGTDTYVVSFNVIGSGSSGTNGGGTNEGEETEKPLSNGDIIGIALGVAVFLAVVIVVTIILGHRCHHKRRTKKVTKTVRTNKDGEEVTIETEIVEIAGVPANISHMPFGEENFDHNDVENDINSALGSVYSVHNSSVVTDTDEGVDVEPNNGKPNVTYTNSSVTLYADDVSEGPPPYDTRNNLEIGF